MDDTRQHFGLTQERYAAWLGVHRSTLALAEAGHRSLPVGVGGVQAVRLDLAALGKTLDAHNQVVEVAPLPEPDPARPPLEQRLRDCRYQVGTLRFELEKLQRRAAPLLNRLAALPALRAWAGPPPKSVEREQRWLATLEAEARQQLRDVCGTGPQQLLQARLAGLEREAQWLEEVLSTLPSAT